MQTVFGYWTVVREVTKRKRLRYFLCRCQCGSVREIYIGNLRAGRSLSCGCHRRELITAHGQSDTTEYRNWQAMKARCYYARHRGYENYGGRGIHVYEPWRDDFARYWFDVVTEIGPRPSGKTLDRINNNGDYAPGNIRWATQREQVANSRLTREERQRRGYLYAMKRWHPESVSA